MTDEELVLKLALDVITRRLDEFIGACMDEAGKPKAPAYRDLMTARGYLPALCANALNSPKKKGSA